MVKLLIADDSALMRKYLGEIFRAERDFEVAVARNGVEALALARSFAPDVITLDVNMPEMDGITCLSRIMVECPKPVVMVSSLTSEGAEVTLQALGLGAVDFIAKPDGTVSLHIDEIRKALVAKVRNAARARPRLSRGLLDRVRQTGRGDSGRADSGRGSEPPIRPAPSRHAAPAEPEPPPGIVLVGVSTGGPGALESVLPRLPRQFPWAVMVAQHMPQSFTGVFARRMNDLSELEVIEVSRPTPLRAGVVYVARGDADMVVGNRAGMLAAIPMPASPRHLWHPSVERMVASALDHVEPRRLLGVLLTGMGDDGAPAMTTLRMRGGRTIAEAEDTAVVWGMPGELVRLGGATLVLPIERVADQIRRWTS